MKKRSVGVTVFAILFLVGGLLGLLSVVVTPQLMKTVLQSPDMPEATKTQLQTTLTMFESRAGLMAAQAAGGVATGVGLLLQLWAWWLTLILAGLSVIQGIIGLFAGGAQGAGVVGMLVGLAVVLAWNGLVVWFFLRQAVKGQFQKSITSG